MAQQVVRDWRRSCAATVYGYPEIKAKTKEATNSDPWGPTDAQKQELAHAAVQVENRELILKALWKRVLDQSEYWMHVYKALDVLEYLLLMEVPGVEGNLRGNDATLGELLSYNYAKSDDPEEQETSNSKVRVKTKRVIQLLTDDEMLSSERQKIRLIMQRLQAIDGGKDPVPSVHPQNNSAASANQQPPSVSPSRPPGGGLTVNAVPVGSRSPHPTAPPKTMTGAKSVMMMKNPNSNLPLEYQNDAIQVNSDLIIPIMEMGFSDTDAVIHALMAADNDPNRAVQFLLNEQEKVKKSSPLLVNPKKAVSSLSTASQPQLVPAKKEEKKRDPLTDLFEQPPVPQNTNTSTKPPIEDLFQQHQKQAGGGGFREPTTVTSFEPAVPITGQWHRSPQLVGVQPNSQPPAIDLFANTNNQNATGGGGFQPTTQNPPTNVAPQPPQGFDPFSFDTPAVQPSQPPPPPQAKQTGDLDFFAQPATTQPPLGANLYGPPPNAGQQTSWGTNTQPPLYQPTGSNAVSPPQQGNKATTTTSQSPEHEKTKAEQMIADFLKGGNNFHPPAQQK